MHAPLASGDHLDHHIVRSAIDGIDQDTVYYDDFPYPEAQEPKHHTLVYQPVDIRAWIDLAILYRSQVRAIFGTLRNFKMALVKRAGAFGKQAGEKTNWAYRMWFRTADA